MMKQIKCELTKIVNLKIQLQILKIEKMNCNKSQFKKTKKLEIWNKN